MPYTVQPPGFSSLEEARSIAEVCRRCDLALTRTLVAFGEGNQQAKLMIVGEGPGEDEDIQGRPFVGRAGALLNRWLTYIGLHREDLWISNIVRCRACSPENHRLVNRQPRASEIEACRVYMNTELVTVKPQLILCLGAVAAKALTYKGFKITQDRGEWLEGPGGSSLLVTFHPAYVLRQQGDARTQIHAMVDSDLAKVRNQYFHKAA